MSPTDFERLHRLRSDAAWLTRDGMRYRAVVTDSESASGVALACDEPDHPAGDEHRVLVYWDCCPSSEIETYHERFARFIVDALVHFAPEGPGVGGGEGTDWFRHAATGGFEITTRPGTKMDGGAMWQSSCSCGRYVSGQYGTPAGAQRAAHTHAEAKHGDRS